MIILILCILELISKIWGWGGGWGGADSSDMHTYILLVSLSQWSSISVRICLRLLYDMINMSQEPPNRYFGNLIEKNLWPQKTSDLFHQLCAAYYFIN